MRPKQIALRLLPDAALWRIQGWRTARRLRREGIAEEPEFGPIPALLRSGDGAVDAGANFGVYTVFLSRLVGDTGVVFSFEPVSVTFRALRSVTRRLRLPNVRLFPCGLSDRPGPAEMKSPLYAKGGVNLYKTFVAAGEKKDRPGRPFRVSLETLDGALPEGAPPIRFIKIDVEGHELALLRGARRTLERFRPALLVEISRNPDEPGSTGHEVFRLLGEMGYVSYLLSDGALRPRRAGDRSVNYFFLTGDHLAALREALFPMNP
ncbi:MAG: FkbM family methyltransferase [Candidatus Eisenbacteria bacterium]|nr:FkbM family methyltransferase [Candidatus Eisenbacteria bacterium]